LIQKRAGPAVAAPDAISSGGEKRMSEWPFHRVTLLAYWPRLINSLAVLALATAPVLAQDDFAGGRRIFLEKADCAYCHGWAGDGAGQGQSPGGAANLRQSKLDRESLIMVISCGIPGKAMPHFDDQAYTDKRCYGMTEAEMGDKVPPFPPSTTLPRRDIELVADYLLAKVIGRGAITRQECEEKLGPRVRSCAELPPAP
jgi:mono/diheme cytochrome c family protein